MIENILMWGPVLLSVHGAAAGVNTECVMGRCEYGVVQELRAKPGDLHHEDADSKEKRPRSAIRMGAPTHHELGQLLTSGCCLAGAIDQMYLHWPSFLIRRRT